MSADLDIAPSRAWRVRIRPAFNFVNARRQGFLLLRCRSLGRFNMGVFVKGIKYHLDSSLAATSFASSSSVVAFTPSRFHVIRRAKKTPFENFRIRQVLYPASTSAESIGASSSAIHCFSSGVKLSSSAYGAPRLDALKPNNSTQAVPSQCERRSNAAPSECDYGARGSAAVLRVGRGGEPIDARGDKAVEHQRARVSSDLEIGAHDCGPSRERKN